MLIYEILEENAKRLCNKTSLIEIYQIEQSRQDKNDKKHRKIISWERFNHSSNQLSNLLISKGVKKGIKVALLMRNCIEWLTIYFGILKTGAIAVPLNYNYTSDEIQHCLNIADCSVLIFGAEFTETIISIKDKLKSINYFITFGGIAPSFAEEGDSIINNFSKKNTRIEINENDVAAIYFSSGTTGFPKAILLSHRALISAAQTEQHHHQQEQNDTFLIIPPLYHTGSKMHWFGSLISGGCAVILKNTSPKAILETIATENITIVWLLMIWAQDILDAIDSGDIDISKYNLTSWRLTHMGAQPIPPEIVQRWTNKFPAQQFDINYGLTEAGGPGCVHLGVENIQKSSSIGKAGYGWDVLVVSDGGSPVPNNVVGELIVKGNGVMVGYYRNPEETAETLRDGWLFTGDMAYKDKDEFIYLVGRKKDLIISGGENIYPIQIENFLKTNPAIKDAAVIGVPNNRLGEIIVAIIEIKPGYHCSKSEIKKFCISLPPYKRPYKFIFGSILRNATGKIQKEKLREQYLLESTWRKHYNGQ